MFVIEEHFSECSQTYEKNTGRLSNHDLSFSRSHFPAFPNTKIKPLTIFYNSL